MQVAGGTNTAADCIAPSARKKRGPRDDRTVGAKQDVTALGHNQEADRTTTKIYQEPLLGSRSRPR
jgi:hypothetical protein